jgi:FkbM family methyltransferase
MQRRLNKSEFLDMADLFKAAEIEPKVVIDGGAYIGFVTHQFLTNFPETHVYSFEPNPKVFSTLKKAYENNTRVTPINAGIGSTTGEMMFQINKRAVTSSFLPATEYHKMNIASSNIQIEKVLIMTIDDAMSKEGVSHIDILKLDIEGFEIEGFKGIKDIDKKVSMVFAEVNLQPTYEGQPLMDDVIIYMREHNFNLVNFYGIIENKYHQATVTNLLFISNEFKSKLKGKLGDKYFGY